MLNMNRDVSVSSVNVFYNDCPSMLEPLKKLSVTKILQVCLLFICLNYCFYQQIYHFIKLFWYVKYISYKKSNNFCRY